MMAPYRFPIGSWSGIDANSTLVVLTNMSTITYLWRYWVKTNQEVSRAMVLELSGRPFPVPNLKLGHSFLHELVIYECVEDGWISVDRSWFPISPGFVVFLLNPVANDKWSSYVHEIASKKKVDMHACVWLKGRWVGPEEGCLCVCVCGGPTAI